MALPTQTQTRSNSVWLTAQLVAAVPQAAINGATHGAIVNAGTAAHTCVLVKGFIASLHLDKEVHHPVQQMYTNTKHRLEASFAPR